METLNTANATISPSGGAIGYVAYDCVRYFEPKTARPMKDPLGIPESVFMLCDTLVAFDHLYQTVKVLSNVFVPDAASLQAQGSPLTSFVLSEVERLYTSASDRIAHVMDKLSATTPIALPYQPPIPTVRPEAVSNIGEAGYKAHVTRLRQHIVRGDIIQAVPSQRLARPTALHPFNAYRSGGA